MLLYLVGKTPSNIIEDMIVIVGDINAANTKSMTHRRIQTCSSNNGTLFDNSEVNLTIFR
jgi:hypothetical protein